MTTESLADIVEGVHGLGVLPEAYREVMAVLDDPHANVSRIAAAIRVDPALTAGVLRLANSAAVSPREPVTTVSRATMVLGTAQLRRMALGTTVVRMFKRIPEHLLSMRSFWEHAVAVAMIAHHLGRRSGWVQTESLFAAGLLHDVGTLLLGVARPEELRRVLTLTENANEPVEWVERRELGFDHAGIGAFLLQQWGLGSLQVAAAGFHHDPEACPEEDRPGVRLVHLADVAASALQLGNGGERAANRLCEVAWASAGLTLDDLEAAIVEAEGQLGDLADALGAAGARAP